MALSLASCSSQCLKVTVHHRTSLTASWIATPTAPSRHQGHSNHRHCPAAALDSAAPTPTLAEEARQRLTGKDGEVWDRCVEAVQDATGVSHVEATQAIAKAYGWVASGFWRQSKHDEVPQLENVQDVLALLTELGISGFSLAKYLRAFPEVLACDEAELLRSNVEKLSREYKMQGDVLTRALMRQPKVLGFNVDCEGNCIGECNRCWIRF